MILRLSLAAIGSVLVTSPIAAQSATDFRNFPVSGNAPQVCAVQAPRLAAGAQINFRGLSGNTLQIDRLVDPTTLATNAASADIQFDAVCNFPHRIRVESQNNGLWQTVERGAQTPDGFAYAVPYRATLTWGEVTGQLDADAHVRRISEQRINVDQATAGAIIMRVVIEAGSSNTTNNAPLIAGFYGDTLRLFVEPR
jgi:hypothetical protein